MNFFLFSLSVYAVSKTNPPSPRNVMVHHKLAGIHHGMQARIRQMIPAAIYTHCKERNVNVAIVHTSKEPLVKCMMDTIQQIAVSFNYVAKGLHALQAELELDEDAQAGMNNITNLQSLCETRWSSRANALYTVISPL